ncbi:MAG: hypothetical protein EP344_09225 [Bacteroidetes bacterium]|nr:MAG: hypothetical protein EP344_09225 [Bacteroidota bacterium]
MIGDSTLHFIEYELQAIALAWMAMIYLIKIWQLATLKMPWDTAEQKGSTSRGILQSYGAIFMPWSMESSRTHFWRWLEFGTYHVGALVAIVNTFTYPFAPDFMAWPVRLVFAVLIAPSVLVGFLKLFQRITKPELRMISTPDDYFSLAAMQAFLFLAVMALLTNAPVWRMWYFLVTAFFLFYVPFSKISHYIYFFFARFIVGTRYGVKGVIPQGKA